MTLKIEDKSLLEDSFHMEYINPLVIEDGEGVRCESKGLTHTVYLKGHGVVTITFKPKRQRDGLEPCKEPVSLLARFTSAATQRGIFYPTRPPHTLWQRGASFDIRTRILNPTLDDVSHKGSTVSLYFSGHISKGRVLSSRLDISEYELDITEDYSK